MAMTTVTELYKSESPDERVAAEVRGHAAKRGLRQNDMAAILCVTQGQVSQRLRGRVPFTVLDLYKLAEAFGVEPADLMPKCAVRDLNPEPAGSVSAQVAALLSAAHEMPAAPERGGCLVIPIRRGSRDLTRPVDRRRRSRTAEPHPFGPSWLQFAVSL
jgi:transcriptional regulator with XRE-family HTH domain